MALRIVRSGGRLRGAASFWLMAALVLLALGVAQARRITEADRRHWAFQPLQPVPVPAVRALARVANPIDQFILAALETNGLPLAPRATKTQLIRRLTYDLTGLPPSLEEIDAFVGDLAPDAYEKLIDRLLASPHYGERWGRHWLDLARFAETDGFEHDAVRSHSWRYRDYVIRSFNEDKPYDRFIREQIAGDELFPDDPQALIATGFNLLGPDMVDSADQVQRRHNTLNDMTDTAASVLLGQTLGCARCHNHKTEPFSQRDYYRFQAFFAPAQFQRDFPVPTADQRARHLAETAKYKEQTGKLQRQIDEIERPHREQLHAGKLAKLSEEAQLAHKTPKEKRTTEMENQIQETAEQLKISEAELMAQLPVAEKKRRQELLGEVKRFPKPEPLPMAMALQNKAGVAARTFVLARGDYNEPRDEVGPGFPDILGGTDDDVGSTNTPAAKAASTDKPRTRLAQWLASPENPLVARVMVNRIWQHHFGRGLVTTPSEFGTRAEPATHPALLDWLASEFIAQGWSIKKLHKRILLSETFQQSSEASSAALHRDPDNKWYSRQNRLRLEGEAIRDSLLAVSGRLNDRVGGASVFPPIPASITKVSGNWTASKDTGEHARRSLYIFTRRNLRFPFLEVFDAPDSNLSCPERGQSTTAPQSLTLLNAEEVLNAAEATSALVLQHTNSTSQRIDFAFRRGVGRSPTRRELAAAEEFVKANGGDAAGRGGSADTAWRELCRALFNLNAFVYVD